MALFGYARTSTTDQHPEAQAERLIAYGCDPDFIFTDKGASGAKASRPAWDECMARLRKGDTLVAVRLDRIGRSVRNLIDVADELEKRGISLVCLDQGGQTIDTRTPAGQMLFTILAAVAEFERALIIERTRDGLNRLGAARGREGGRKRRLTPDQVEAAKRARDDKKSIRAIGAMFPDANGKPASRQTVYRALGMLSDQGIHDLGEAKES
jgi:DNA invertase Pin-like site-specific DNA recombinase